MLASVSDCHRSSVLRASDMREKRESVDGITKFPRLVQMRILTLHTSGILNDGLVATGLDNDANDRFFAKRLARFKAV